MGTGATLLCLVIVVAVLAGCSKSGTTIHGTLTAHAAPQYGFCGSTGLRNAAQLTIRDGGGNIIATTTATELTGTYPQRVSDNPTCTDTETYSVNVPKVDFYQVSIQCVTQPSDPVSYGTLKAQNFELDFTVTGNDC
jgi:hypothetical protein